jgi:hypothetical protein
MARLARVVIPGLPHHVTQRGNGRSRVFFSDADYALYRDLLAVSCRDAGNHTANLTLLGQYATAQFTPASDGHGGVLIGDPPVMATADVATIAAGNSHQG